MEKIVVILPWPDKRLSPNSRVHHLTLWRVKKKAKGAATMATWAAMGTNRPFPFGKPVIPVRYRVTITATPKDNRRRDEDNLQASLKAALDGVAAALGIDDHHFRIEGTRILPARPDKRRQIEITIQPEVKP
jgi:crossover junction endodeoxyribonuclease RusA